MIYRHLISIFFVGIWYQARDIYAKLIKVRLPVMCTRKDLSNQFPAQAGRDLLLDDLHKIHGHEMGVILFTALNTHALLYTFKEYSDILKAM